MRWVRACLSFVICLFLVVDGLSAAVTTTAPIFARPSPAHETPFLPQTLMLPVAGSRWNMVGHAHSWVVRQWKAVRIQTYIQGMKANRSVARLALIAVCDPTTVAEALVLGLRDPDIGVVEVRRAAIVAISQLPELADPTIIESLEFVQTNSGDPVLSAAAAHALQQISRYHSGEVVGPLVRRRTVLRASMALVAGFGLVWWRDILFFVRYWTTPFELRRWDVRLSKLQSGAIPLDRSQLILLKSDLRRAAARLYADRALSRALSSLAELLPDENDNDVPDADAIHHAVDHIRDLLRQRLPSSDTSSGVLMSVLPLVFWSHSFHWASNLDWRFIPALAFFGYFLYVMESDINSWSRVWTQPTLEARITSDGKPRSPLVKTSEMIATPEDLAAIRRLIWDGFSPRNHDPLAWIKFGVYFIHVQFGIARQMRKSERDPHYNPVLLMKTESGQVIGMVRYRLTARNLSLGFSDLTVAMSYRGRGYGERLIQQLIERTRRQHPMLHSVYFSAMPDSHTIDIARRLALDNQWSLRRLSAVVYLIQFHGDIDSSPRIHPDVLDRLNDAPGDYRMSRRLRIAA